MKISLIYKMIFRESKGVFISFSVLTSLFLLTSFMIVFLLNGYQSFIMENMVFGNFHIEMKRKDDGLITQEQMNTIKEQITGIGEENKVIFFSDSQALLKHQNLYTGSNVFSVKYIDPDLSVFKKAGLKKFDKDKVMIGQGVAGLLGVKVGDTISINGLEEKISLEVGSIFSTGVYDVDYSTIFIHPEKYALLNILPVGFFKAGVLLEDFNELEKVKAVLKENLAGFEMYDFFETNKVFQGAINMEKMITTIVSLFLMFMFFFVVALFVFSRLNVYRREFSYLIVMGLKKSLISKNVWSIMVKGFVSVFLLASILSYVLCLVLNGNIKIPEEVYYVDSLYFDFDINYLAFYFFFFVTFNFILKYMTSNYFNSLLPDEELRKD